MAAGSKSAAEERHDDGELELSLRLRTGGSSSGGSGSNAAAEEEVAAAAARRRRRSMTIFYNGRVCAVDVTEQRARTIITMASNQLLTEQQQRGDSDPHLQLQDSSSSNNKNAAAAHSRGAPAPQRPAPSLAPSPLPQGLIGATEGTVVSHAAVAGLSMKRSLQQFLQKRKKRVAAVGSPYAGGQPTRHSAMPS